MKKESLIEAISKRRSIRAFSETRVDESKLRLLFEAARWAASSRNEQPWRYFYASRENEGSFEQFLHCLNPANQVWARFASWLLLSVAKTNFSEKDRPNKHALHDTGAANAQLALQAAEMGLQVHQMAGFDREKTLETFGINPDEVEPVSFIAVGYPGNSDRLPDNLREREDQPRERKPIGDFTSKIIL